MISNNSECSVEGFLNDVKNHSLEILQDNGIHRHLKFKKEGTYAYYFELITWTNSLCISGDMGTYVFRRIEDMFSFFRMKDYIKESIDINPHYWMEKLDSESTIEKAKKYDPVSFRKRVNEYYDRHVEELQGKIHKDYRENLWKDIAEYVLYFEDNEFEAYTAVQDFDFEDFRFEDFFDGGGTESYTYHYIWCLYAIVWGIRQYDERQI